MTTPEKNLPPELASLEAKLASLKPSPGRLDRDRLMYELGQAQATPKTASAFPLKWTLGLTLTSNVVVALVMFLILQPVSHTNPSRATGVMGSEPTVMTQTAENVETVTPTRVVLPSEMDVQPDESEPPADSESYWGSAIAVWLGLPTYDSAATLQSQKSRYDIDRLLAQTSYTGPVAKRTVKPGRPLAVKKKEKFKLPFLPPTREELMKPYLGDGWDY